MSKFFPYLAAIVLYTVSSFSQAPEGAIVGTVRDTQGMRIAEASLTARAIGFELSRSVTANRTGEFRVPALPPGQYRIHAEAKGLSAQDLIVQLPVGGNPSVQVVMGPAPVRQTLNVEGNAVSLTEQPIETTTNVIKT